MALEMGKSRRKPNDGTKSFKQRLEIQSTMSHVELEVNHLEKLVEHQMRSTKHMFMLGMLFMLVSLTVACVIVFSRELHESGKGYVENSNGEPIGTADVHMRGMLSLDVLTPNVLTSIDEVMIQRGEIIHVFQVTHIAVNVGEGKSVTLYGADNLKIKVTDTGVAFSDQPGEITDDVAAGRRLWGWGGFVNWVVDVVSPPPPPPVQELASDQCSWHLLTTCPTQSAVNAPARLSEGPLSSFMYRYYEDCVCDAGWTGACCDLVDYDYVFDNDFQYTYDAESVPGIAFHANGVPDSEVLPIEYKLDLAAQGLLPVVANLAFVGRCSRQKADTKDPETGISTLECTPPTKAFMDELAFLVKESKAGGANGVSTDGLWSALNVMYYLFVQDKDITDADVLNDLVTCSSAWSAAFKNAQDITGILTELTECMLGKCGVIENGLIYAAKWGVGSMTEADCNDPDYGRGATVNLPEFASYFQAISADPDVLASVVDNAKTDTVPVAWLRDDEMFGYIRMVGPNADMLRAATTNDIQSSNFDVTDKMYTDVMGSGTLQGAIDAGKVFILDYYLFNGAESKIEGKYLFSPKALFAVGKDGDDSKLWVIAIQLYNDDSHAPGGTNPVLTPPPANKREWGADGMNLSSQERADLVQWGLAKFAVQSADASYFELTTHLGRTHLVMEPIILATHRKLPANHPIKRLLEPHFEGTFSINQLANDILIAPDSTIDLIFPPNIKNAQKIATGALGDHGTKQFLADINGQYLPLTLAARGVENFPANYPYRDDAILYWDAILKWAGNYVNHNYADDAAVENDARLKSWAKELKTDGLLNNFGDNGDGNFKSRAYLAKFVSLFMFTASAQHASTNYPQSTLGAYIPIMGASAFSNPLDINAATVDDFSFDQNLPNKALAIEQLNLMYLLGHVWYNLLGQYYDGEGQSIFSGVEEQLRSGFQSDIDAIGLEIARRNQETGTQRKDLWSYTILVPENVPQSINI